MIGGYISSAFLAAAGVAGVLIPERIAPVLDTPLPSGRARAEFRIANGAFAGIGVWALIEGSAALFIGVGLAWAGAAMVRLLALALDSPRADWTYWAFLALEAGLAFVALVPGA
ncbi:MAG: DUF4345 family protein [Actinomycetota bacterium]